MPNNAVLVGSLRSGLSVFEACRGNGCSIAFGKEMKIFSLILVGSCFLLGACSKNAPSHPAVGLRVLLDGTELARSGFYSSELVRSEGHEAGFEVSIKSRRIEFKSHGHHVIIEWEADFRADSDAYTFSFVVDGAHSVKDVTFAGDPVSLLEQPFQITLENLAP